MKNDDVQVRDVFSIPEFNGPMLLPGNCSDVHYMDVSLRAAIRGWAADDEPNRDEQPKALVKRHSQPKPTRAKLQNQNLHRRVAKGYCQVEPACEKTIQLSDYDRVVT